MARHIVRRAVPTRTRYLAVPSFGESSAGWVISATVSDTLKPYSERWVKETVETCGFFTPGVVAQPRPVPNAAEPLSHSKSNMHRFEDLPYRPCVGVMVLNRA